MTREELLAVKKHVRIKYVGKDPEVIQALKAEGNKSAEKRGWVLNTCYEPYYKDEGIRMYFYNGPCFTKVKPEDWVVADDRRVDLQRKREQRQIEYAQTELHDMLDDFISGEEFKYKRNRLNRTLGDLPVTAKFKILAELNPLQQAWYSFLQMKPEDINKLIEKINGNEDRQEQDTDTA